MDVSFDKSKNGYFSGTKEYRRVTRILSMFKQPFDREGISLAMARSKARSGQTVEEAQKEILASWDDMRDSSVLHGNTLHGIAEEYLRNGYVTPGYEKLISIIRKVMMEYKRPESEVISYLHSAMIAGTIDLRCRRQSGKNSLVDYFDFKTNERRGIEYDSISRKDGVVKHYNKMLLPPLSHLEDCNYNIYSLQISLYAYMDEMELGYKPGKLGILFISKNQSVKYLPVAYLRSDVEKIVEHVKNIKQLP